MGKNTIDLTQNVDDIIKNMASIIENILLQAHPVGSYYFSDDPTDPSELFGGTWEALTPGYTLVAQGKATEQHGSTTWTKEFKAGQKYGEFEHQLTVGGLASHYPRVSCDSGMPSGEPSRELFKTVDCRDQYGPRSLPNAWGKIGNDEYHNNISPSKAAYAWQRTM